MASRQAALLERNDRAVGASRRPAVPGRAGMIIELFGPAAAGKTTLAYALAAPMEARGIAVRVVASSRPAEQRPRQPGAVPMPGLRLTTPLARASKLFSALGVLMPGAPFDPLVGQLMQTLPPKSWAKAMRIRRYLRNLCRSWTAALASDCVVIFDQGFMNSVCSLALFSARVDRPSLVRALSLIPAPDLLLRIETPREVLEPRLQKRLRRQGPFERLFENDIRTSLRQVELSSVLDELLAERDRRSMRVSWLDRTELAVVADAVTDEVMSMKGGASA